MTTTSSPQTQLQDHLENTWKQLAWKRLSHAAKSQRRPQAILIASQPGSARSTVAELYRRQFHQSGGCVVIDPEDLILLHPTVATCSTFWSKSLAEYVQSASAELAVQFMNSTVEKQFHLVAVCTLECEDSAVALLSFLKDHNYETSVVVPVVSPRVSSTRIRNRLAEGICLPFMPGDENAHHQLIETLLNVVDHIEQSDAVTRLLLLDDQLQCLLEMNQTTGFTGGLSRSVCRQAMDRMDFALADEFMNPRISVEPAANPSELKCPDKPLASDFAIPAHPGLSRLQQGTELTTSGQNPTPDKTTGDNAIMINADQKTIRRREWQQLLRRLADSNR